MIKLKLDGNKNQKEVGFEALHSETFTSRTYQQVYRDSLISKNQLNQLKIELKNKLMRMSYRDKLQHLESLVNDAHSLS